MLYLLLQRVVFGFTPCRIFRRLLLEKKKNALSYGKKSVNLQRETRAEIHLQDTSGVGVARCDACRQPLSASCAKVGGEPSYCLYRRENRPRGVHR